MSATDANWATRTWMHRAQTEAAHAEWIKVDREAGQAKEDYEGMVAKSTAALHRFVSGRQEAAKARLALREVLVQQLDRHRQTSFFASQQQIRKRAFQLREQRSAQLKELAEVQQRHSQVFGQIDEIKTLQAMNESIQEATEQLKQDVVQVRNSIHSTYALQHHERTAHEERKRRLEAELTKLQIENLGDYQQSLEREAAHFTGIEK